MTIRTFEKLLVDAQRAGVSTTRGKESLQWLSSAAKRVNTNASEVLKQGEKSEFVNINQIVMGKMYLFYYDSKLYKQKKSSGGHNASGGTLVSAVFNSDRMLPYFDRSPLIFPVDLAKGGFYGINLHYLPYVLRGRLMDALYDIENNARFSKNKKLNLSYQALKATGNLWKPCFKHYLFTGIKSRFFKIGYESWGSAAFLPLATWEGASESKVWSDSKKKIK